MMENKIDEINRMKELLDTQDKAISNLFIENRIQKKESISKDIIRNKIKYYQDKADYCDNGGDLVMGETYSDYAKCLELLLNEYETQINKDNYYQIYQDLKRNKKIIKNIDTDFFFEFVECLISECRNEYRINEEHRKINGELREKIQELEKQIDYDKTHILTPAIVNLNYIPKQKIEELKEQIQLDNTIIGGNRNKKTLEYGIKLGKIKAYEELLKGDNNG